MAQMSFVLIFLDRPVQINSYTRLVISYAFKFIQIFAQSILGHPKTIQFVHSSLGPRASKYMQILGWTFLIKISQYKKHQY